MQGTLVGNKVFLFGGEDAARRPQGDLFVLDLADMEWQTPEVTGAHISTSPASLTDSTATASQRLRRNARSGILERPKRREMQIKVGVQPKEAAVCMTRHLWQA